MAINPALVHGMAHEIGSVAVGKWADLVVWKPAFFGVKLALVLKGGTIALTAMGDPNASIPTPQPVHYRPMFGSFGSSLTQSSITFVSKSALALYVKAKFALKKRISAVHNICQVKRPTWCTTTMPPCWSPASVAAPWW